MSAAPKMCESPCETCAKEGLPLLLTRYALMHSGLKAPKLKGKLIDARLNQVPLGNDAHYGLRLLRSGYVYVYDEARKHFDEYFVTVDGYLSKLPARVWALKQQHRPATEFQCARNGAAPLAGVITIRNPKHATKVWIAFSNASWTKALFDKHQDADWRAKHMRCITVSGGKVAPQAGTAPLGTLTEHIAEFKLEQNSAADAFSEFSPHRYNGRQSEAEALLYAVEKVRPQGGAAIVALHDPVGLALEIAGLMELRKTTYFIRESVAKPRFAANTIASLERSIKEQAKLDEMAAAEQLANQMVADGGLANLLPSYQRAVGEVRKTTPAALQRVADKKWRTYTHDRTGKPRFDYTGSQAWLQRHNVEVQKYDTEHIAPLAKAHVAWLQHPGMVNHLTCTFDTADRDSGVAFTTTAIDLMRGTTDKQPSYDLYLKWLKAGEFTDDNLVMRALGFNQAELINKLKEADAAPVDGRVFPSDAVMSAVGAFMAKMPPATKAQLTALMAGLSGPALKYWDDFNAGKVVGGKAAAALAAVSGKQFVRLPVVGNKGEFIQAYMRQLYQLSPSLKVHPNQLQSAISRQIELLKIEGVKMQGSPRTLAWYVLLEKETVAQATSKNLSGQALADELVLAIRKPDDLKKLDMSRAMNASGKLAGAATVLSGVLMLLNYGKLLSDVETGMSHELDEARTKLRLGSIALGAFVSEQTGDLLEKLGEQRLKNMMGRAGAFVPRALQLAGRFAGFGVGVFLGIWDITKGWGEIQKRDTGLAAGYIISGGAAIGISAVMLGVAMGWIALGPVGWAVLAVCFVVWLGATFFIESNKDNKVHEWLARCHFGFGADKYPDTAKHADEYKRAVAS